MTKHPRSFFIHTAAISSILSLSSVVAPGATPIAHQISPPSGMSWCDDTMINGLFTQVNAFRSQNGAPALAMSTVGMKDAEIRATQFAAYMAATPPGSPGFNPHQGYDTTAASLGYAIVSENLAYISTDPAYIVGAIWQDPLHLAALLATGANVMGVSCVYYNGTPFWTYEPGACTGTSCAAPAPTPAPPPPTPTPVPPPSGSGTLDSEEWAFLTLVNTYRAQNGLGPLQVSTGLESAARWMSNDMASKNYFSHTDSLGRTTGARLAALGYPYSPWGENLAAGYSDAQSTFNQWANACDPDAAGTCTYAHRKNMLGAGYAVIGIARTSGAGTSYGWYWTTDFGGYVDQVISPPSPGSTTPVINSFTVTPAGITAGQTATLSWNVTGSTAIAIDNGVGAVASTGSRTVAPTQTTTYTITAGSAVAHATVTVIAANDTSPPSTPVLISAAAKTFSEIDLTWSASKDNLAVAGYQILRNGSALGSVSAATLAYADTGLNPGVSYTYSVKAFDAAGNYSAASNALQAATAAAPPPAQSCPSPGAGVFTGCYYSNLALSGTPVLVRTDSQINFDWGFKTPAPAIPPGPFSVRWSGDFTFTGGAYTFTATTSDGMRIYIDGMLVLDRWYDQPAYIYTIRQVLAPGTHRIAVEYYLNNGYSTAHLTWRNSTPAVQAPSILSFAANPSTVPPGQAATLSWSINGASTITIDGGIGDVTGSASRVIVPSATKTYTLTASNAAGSSTAKVTVTVANAQDQQPPAQPVLISALATNPAQVDLAWSAATDNVAVTGYQVLRNGSALASLAAATLTYSDRSAAPNTTYTYSIRAFDGAGNYSGSSNSIQVTTPTAPASGSCPAPASAAFTACYFNNLTLSGNPVLSRTDSQVNFDWGSGSPAASVTPANFSAHWSGYFDLAAGTYSFVAKASDGVRVYIDGRLIIDQWQDHPVSMFQARPTLSQGSHLITVEYYAHTGWASAHLTWIKY